MKSSKDIEPRVGMQLYAAEYVTKRHRIVRIRNMLLGVSTDTHHHFHDNKWGHDSSQWNCGDFEIEWIPPTDEERKMFVDFADDYKGIPRSEFFHAQYSAFLDCFRGEVGTKDIVALSLALDGADYDNMPDLGITE